MENKFNGKAIYNPSGKAGEYSYWACNLYVGCSAKCEYCYCKQLLRGQWTDTPHLKKTLLDEQTAFRVFCKEMRQNKDELKKHGLFFNFVSDPCLEETKLLNWECIEMCLLSNIPVKVLTKQTKWINDFNFDRFLGVEKEVAIGFTLTGHDELETGASTNEERIEAMKLLHERGFLTWASIEPIIDLDSSLEMIYKTVGFCDLYKIGLQSGRKYDKYKLSQFFNHNVPYILQHHKIYWKDSILLELGIERKNLSGNCVNRDYNIFIGI